MKNYLLLILFLPVGFTGTFTEGKAQQSHIFQVAFYNVENLFDTRDDPYPGDDAFTPGGANRWEEERYRKKISDIARVISEMDTSGLPAVVGLCEVENRKVLKDMIAEPLLASGNYGIVHHDGPDFRGIDVAMIYRKDLFEVAEERTIPVLFPFDTITTRNILYVKGLAAQTDTLHLFINHWSSRSEGQRQTERRRIYSAVTLRRAVDSVMNYQPTTRILIMGDFNDEPTNTSLHTALNANNKRVNASVRELYNLMYDMHNFEGEGTYNYRGEWNMLDQIIVSRSLLDATEGIKATIDGGKIYRAEWMMFDHPQYGTAPNRTYGGSRYYGGISDHLPVYTRLIIIR
ncbi:MAG TPA: hypothetical protein ENN63_03790 [Bacteroidetes bacterium]|nr:hypothetical protein [Bacteroidota bacterium]